MTQESTTMIVELTCTRCGHKWFPRRPGFPTRCPKCISPYWNRLRQLRTKNNDVNNAIPEKKYRLLCLRCGHDWASDNIHPTRCAKCKSPYWDKIRVNIVGKAESLKEGSGETTK